MDQMKKTKKYLKQEHFYPSIPRLCCQYRSRLQSRCRRLRLDAEPLPSSPVGSWSTLFPSPSFWDGTISRTGCWPFEDSARPVLLFDVASFEGWDRFWTTGCIAASLNPKFFAYFEYWPLLSMLKYLQASGLVSAKVALPITQDSWSG